MSNNNFMYRTMFLLSDGLHQNSSQHSRPLPPLAKKPQGSYTNVFDKDCQCEGSNAVFYGVGNGFVSSLPENKIMNPKLLVPYSSLQLVATSNYATKKEDLLGNHLIHSVSSCSDQQGAESRSTLQSTFDSRPQNIKVVKERPHSCEDCGKTFLLKHHLVTHARVHSGERPHVCVHCGKSFTHKHCLSTHLLLHTSDRPYTCQECNKSFTLKHHLVTHARVHNRARPYVCQECGRTFPQKRHLVTHAKFHSGERPFVCSECGESFAQEDHLVLHSRFHGEQHPYHCHDCGLSFARKFELVNHSRIHGRVPYSCAACKKEFLQKRSYQAHLRLHTSADSVEHPFCCIHCGEAFQEKSELAAHSCGDKDKNYICRECGNSFSSREGLSLHLRLHAGDRSFVPDLCSLAAAFQQDRIGANPKFRSNAAVQRGTAQLGNNRQSGNGARQLNQQRLGTNTKVMNEPEERDPLALDGVSTVTSSKTVPKTFPSNSKPKPHVCQDCGRAFAQKHGLIQHNKRYTSGGCELRRFVCEKCGKAFLQKNHLVLHERQHLDPQERNNGAKARSKAQSQLSEGDVDHTSLVSPAEDNLSF